MATRLHKSELGECLSVSITSISEIGWHDTALMLSDIRSCGGPEATQWHKDWHRDNAAGSSSLIEVQMLDRSIRKFIIDCGWDIGYMTKRFQAIGIDRMLENGSR